jgi:hypothetical protein
MEKAGQAVAHIMQLEPDFNSETYGRRLPFKDPAIRSRFIDTLKKAGFP